jgi:hypothetical protein
MTSDVSTKVQKNQTPIQEMYQVILHIPEFLFTTSVNNRNPEATGFYHFTTGKATILTFVHP